MTLKLLVSDLDGTLLRSSGKVSAKNLKALQQAREEGIIRVLATGRSIYSLQKNSLHHLPFDFIVFSCGAGVWNVSQKKLNLRFNLTKKESQAAFELLNELNVDFSVQYAVPDNHYYYFIRKTKSNPDFDRRNNIYKSYCHEISPDKFRPSVYCQMIAVLPEETGVETYKIIKNGLTELNVVRSTSPIDHKSVWIEVFNKRASKLNGIKLIAKSYRIPKSNIMCCGNDFNDEEMLDWCGNPFIVDNAPKELKAKYTNVVSNDKNGFYQAYQIWTK